MDPIDHLLTWADVKGIVLNGIRPRVLPGRGIGILATRDLKANETILTVPSNALRTLDNTSKSITEALQGATVHAILATALCLDFHDTPDDFAIWKAVFPSLQDIITSMPLCWPQDLVALLPPKAQTLLSKQSAKFDKDWSVVSSAAASLPASMTRPQFLYAWLLVNTRTFYHTTPATKAKLPKEDHMVLQPVADLFNHSPDGCSVAFGHKGFQITTTHAHKAGDELFIRYGSHSNDFLLVEYGFTIPSPENPFDETALDPYLCPRFTPAQKELLEEEGFWTGYMLDSQTACYRTQTALRLLCLPEWQWRAVLDGQRDEDEDGALVDAELLKLLRKYEKDARATVTEIDQLDKVGEDESRRLLRERWIEIRQLIDTNAARLSQQ
ncbi:unnamed protein product [Clonostachys rhizophaga]|uniref:SET domain-containing protein n=1 Tax=Clonostachys rhizophaga TaxID=160324 RepID=A0A9N9YII4_9HYPO|nr:unnamed protein product [Clonostachys rhizophaga]